jgi:DNA polymerase III delta subunit
LFVYKVGTTLYRVKSEIEKLKLYCETKNIDQVTDELINDIVFGLVETEAFEFLKLMFKDKNQAVTYLQRMQDQ